MPLELSAEERERLADELAESLTERLWNSGEFRRLDAAAALSAVKVSNRKPPVGENMTEFHFLKDRHDDIKKEILKSAYPLTNAILLELAHQLKRIADNMTEIGRVNTAV